MPPQPCSRRGAQAAPTAGQATPDFTLKDTSGKTVRLSDFRGKPVVWLSINSTEKVSSDYLEPAKLMAWTQDRKAAPTALLMDEEGTWARATAPAPRHIWTSATRRAS